MIHFSGILDESAVTPVVEIVAGRCLRRRLNSFDCSLCVDSCPANALTVVGADIHLENEKCTGCGRCVAVCPAEAFGFIGYDLHETLDGCRAFDNTVFTCHRGNATFPDAVHIPCIGVFPVEALLSIGLKAKGSVYFDLLDCADCSNCQAAAIFIALLARVQQALAADSPIQLIAIKDKAELPHFKCQDRRSFLLDLGSNVASFVKSRYFDSRRPEEISSSTTRRLPKKTAFLQKSILSFAGNLSDSFLAQCFPSFTLTASCTLCPRCMGMCPTGALRLERQPGSNKRLMFIAARCTGCGLCAAFCKEKALAISRPPLLADLVSVS